MRGGIGIACMTSLTLVAGGAAFGQEHPLYVIHQEVVKPSMQQQYEASGKEFAAMVLKNRAAMPHFSYVGLSSDDFVYTYVAPIPDHGGIDGIGQDFGALAQKEGQAFVELMKRNGAALEYVKEWVVSEVPELCYTPATPRLKPEEMRFFHYDVYYVMPDREAEADALAKEFLALFKGKNVPSGYRLFKADMGPEMPAIVIEVGARDPADFYNQNVANQAAVGAAGKALFARAFAITRRFETKSGWLRPDLSAPSPAPKPQK
jgi:hypothetical protein